MPGPPGAFPEKTETSGGGAASWGALTLPQPEALLEHVEFLRALARSLLRSEADAEDVVQQTLLTAMERPPAPGNLRAWLATVTRNFARMTYRRRERARRREFAAARAESAPSPAEIAARMEMERRVVDAVHDLEEPYRSTLILHFYDGMQPTEIARHLGVPASTVRVRLKRGLDRIRARLEEKSGRRALMAGLLLLAQQAKPARRFRWAAALLVAVGATVAFVATRGDPEPARMTPPMQEGARPATVVARDDEATAVTVRGRIIDSFDRPRPGVELLLLPAPPRGRFTTLPQYLARLTREPTVLARATTDADGRYALEAPAAGEYLVRARREEAIFDAPLDGLDFRLVGEAVTRGRIVDEEGLPIGGAWVSGEVTGVDGRFEFSGEREMLVVRVEGFATRLMRDPPFVVRRGAPYEVDVSADASVVVVAREAFAFGASVPEFPSTDPMLVVSAPGMAPFVGNAPVELVPGRVVEGLVHCGGKPIAGAFVTWVGAYDVARVASTQLEVARTDARGRYRLTHVPAGALQVTAIHPDYLPKGLDLLSHLLSPKEPVGPLRPDIEMVRAREIRGHVRGAPGTRVSARPLPSSPRLLRSAFPEGLDRALDRAGLRWSAVTASDGSFVLRQLPPKGPLEVIAEHPTLGRARGITPTELVLRPHEAVEGTVVDERGTPVAGASIRGEGVRGWSAPDGRFRLHRTPLGPLTVSHPAFETAIVDYAPRLTLRSGAVVRGRVDAPGALVIAGRRFVRADAQGRFEIAGLGEGPQRIELSAPGRVMRVLDAEAGGAALDIVLEPAATLEGQLYPAVAGARVHALVGGHAVDHARTDADGRFRLDGVPERARFALRVFCDGYEELRVEAVTAGGRQQFEMKEKAK